MADDDSFISGERLRPCVVCGVPTDQVEVNFEAPVHPGACEQQLWRRYLHALVIPETREPLEWLRLPPAYRHRDVEITEPL